MSTKYKFHDQGQLYFVSFAVVNWIDLFIRKEYEDIMIASWKHCQENKGLEIFGWCIMSSHIHMIVGTHGDKLENIMRDMKKHTSLALKAAIEQHPGEKSQGMDIMDDETGRKKERAECRFPVMAAG